MMKIAVLATSRKKHEQRRPIHPEHLTLIPEEVRKQMFFEQGYGLPFGLSDEEIGGLVGGIDCRETLLREADLVILAKPLAEDAEAMKFGATLWGWVHCVQGQAITQAAIDRKLNYITWEMMNHWGEDGSFRSHIFYANNQLAGYAAVFHALALKGFDGYFGPRKRVILINTGQVSQGALRALSAQGFTDITVLGLQEPSLIPNEFSGIRFYTLESGKDEALQARNSDGECVPLIHLLGDAEIIINGIFQNPLNPYLFVRKGEELLLKRNALIIDVSCDAGMGFHFAHATSFDKPIIRIGQLDYYAVDHTPSYLWHSATWQISEALIPYLPTVLSGPSAWQADPVIHRAIEIQNGEVKNAAILAFQERRSQYPHEVAL